MKNRIGDVFALSKLGMKLANPKIAFTPEYVFPKLVDNFRKRGIKFLLHGAWAMAAYGRVRATKNFDFIVAYSEDNVYRIFDMFSKKKGVPIIFKTPQDVIKRKPKHIMFYCYAWEVDIWLSQKFQRFWKRRVLRKYMGKIIPIVHYKDLIALKKERGTALDFEDIKELRKRLKARQR